MPSIQVSSAAPAAVLPLPPLGLPLELGYCIDDTGSVHGARVEPGKRLLKRALAAMIRRGFPGLQLHVRKIGKDSWSPSAELLTGALAGVHAYPAPPRIGYFTPLKRRQELQAPYVRARAAVNAELAAAKAQLAALDRQIAAIQGQNP